MAMLKCKMCGGNLISGGGLFTCESCGTVQTAPTGEDDRKLNLFNRANKQRLACEFDKAAALYEKLVTEFPEDAEGYWGLCLSKYGIEYVDDPGTGKKVPTCHRASFEAITADPDYRAALDHADAASRAVYMEQGYAIDTLQHGIMEIVRTEKPFDVFLCYKETDENGRRTPDSVIANDIYYQLTNEGFKVFYAAITLENKLGQAYEPYIFAALHSAKVMLVIGTSPEYFGAVWVRNEWSRFLKLMKTDRSKLLIPCYKDMDAYELPEEFSHLQAQDMSKIGFITDVIRGVKKVLQKDAPAPAAPAAVPATAAPAGTANTAALLKRAALFLGDGDWKSADEYCERVLDQEPENAEAYVGKLLAELNVRSRDALREQPQPFDQSANYQKALRFGNETLKTELTDAVRHIKDRNEKARKDEIYDQALNVLNSAKTEQDYENAAKLFRQIPRYRDADQKAEEAETGRKEWIYKNAERLRKEGSVKSLEKAAKEFGRISGYRDADKKAEEAETGRKEWIYRSAEFLREEGSPDQLEKAVKEFGRISGYRDADARAKEASETLEAVLKEKKRKAAKTKKAVLLGILAAVILIVGFIILNQTVLKPNKAYNAAVELMNEENYGEAIAAFQALNGYKDSSEQIEAISQRIYDKATALMKEGKYAAAGMYFGQIGDFKDAAELSRSCWEKAGKAGLWKTIAAGSDFTVGLKTDGTVIAVGSNAYGQSDVSGWTDIVDVATGFGYTVGLKADGTVVAVGAKGFDDLSKYSDVTVPSDATIDYGQCDVSDWKDIVAIAAGESYTIGLKADGTVVAVGTLHNISNWQNIVAVAAGDDYTIGLKVDGTVVSTRSSYDFSGWTDIVAVAVMGWRDFVGLKADGTVVSTRSSYDFSGWKDIVAVAAGTYHTVGLKADGNVVAVGANYDGECDVSGWKNIVAVAAGRYYTVGLKADGSVVAVGRNNDEQCDVSAWKNIRVPEQ